MVKFLIKNIVSFLSKILIRELKRIKFLDYYIYRYFSNYLNFFIGFFIKQIVKSFF